MTDIKTERAAEAQRREEIKASRNKAAAEAAKRPQWGQRTPTPSQETHGKPAGNGQRNVTPKVPK